MKTARTTAPWTFVKEAKVISAPGATLKVRKLTLTDFGKKAITSGSAGIKQGALEEAGPPSPPKKLESA